MFSVNYLFYVSEFRLSSVTGRATIMDIFVNPILVAGDLWIEILGHPKWDRIIWPEGVYEPPNASRIGTYKSRFNITFVNLTAGSGNLLECMIRTSDGSLKSVNQLLGSDYNGENVTLSYNLQVSDSIDKTVPWHVVNCTLYNGGGNVIYSTSKYYNEFLNQCLAWEKNIAVHKSRWYRFSSVDEDAYRAGQCFLGYPKYYFNNSWYCDYAGDVAYVVKNSLSLKYENHCHDNIDNDGDFLVDGFDHDCRGITYSNQNHSYAGDPFTGSCTNGLCTDTREFQMHSVTYTYTRYVPPGGTLKVRMNGGGYSTSQPVSYSITHLGEPGNSGHDAQGNYNYHGRYLPNCSTTDITYQCQAEAGTYLV
jgi:hypothetical protein